MKKSAESNRFKHDLSIFIMIYLNIYHDLSIIRISLSNVNVRQCLWGVWGVAKSSASNSCSNKAALEILERTRKHHKTWQDVARRGSILISLILCDSRYLSIFHGFSILIPWFSLIPGAKHFICRHADADTARSKISKVRCAKWSKWSKWSGLRLTSCVPPSRHSAQPAPPRWQSRPRPQTSNASNEIMVRWTRLNQVEPDEFP